MKITGFSTARFASWFHVEDLNIMFDCGDGAAAHLGNKCSSVQHVFLSHADRDHIAGLVQFYQLGSKGAPRFYYPKDSSSFPALRDFLEAFDPRLPPAEWVAVAAGDRIEIGHNRAVLVGENDHLTIASAGAYAGLTKSLDFKVVERRHHLKAEFQGLPGSQLAELRATHGEDYLTTIEDHGILGYSGDTPALDAAKWHGNDILFHEATFIAPDHGKRGHSELSEVLHAAAKSALKTLVLVHFSNRYEDADIYAAVRKGAEAAGLDARVLVVPPNRFIGDVLGQDAAWPIGQKAPALKNQSAT